MVKLQRKMGFLCSTKELSKEIKALEDDLERAQLDIEEKAKDARYLQSKLQNAEKSLRQAEKEAKQVKEQYESLKNEHKILIETNQKLLKQLQENEAESKPVESKPVELKPKTPSLKRRQGVKPSLEDRLNKVSVKVIDKPAETANKLRSALKSCDMLRTLPDANVETMVSSMEREDFNQRKPVIIQEGDKGEHLYIILSGAVIVDLNTGPKVIQAPYVLGEIALIYNTPRTCTIRGRDCELWSLRRDVFGAIMRDQDDHIDR